MADVHVTAQQTSFFSQSLNDADPQLAGAIAKEIERLRIHMAHQIKLSEQESKHAKIQSASPKQSVVSLPATAPCRRTARSAQSVATRVTRTLPPVLNVAQPGVVEMGALLQAAGKPFAARAAPAAAIPEVALDAARLQALLPASRQLPRGSCCRILWRPRTRCGWRMNGAC